jgi:hypothetical protein
MRRGLKIAQEIEHEQDNKDKAKPAAATDMTPVGISAAAEEKNKDYNKED